MSRQRADHTLLLLLQAPCSLNPTGRVATAAMNCCTVRTLSAAHSADAVKTSASSISRTRRLQQHRLSCRHMRGLSFLRDAAAAGDRRAQRSAAGQVRRAAGGIRGGEAEDEGMKGRPCESRDPYAAAVLRCRLGTAVVSNSRLWLWVPARARWSLAWPG